MAHPRTSPQLLAIVVCDQTIQDAKTRKTSLIGLFNVVCAQRFPCTHRHLSVFVALTDGHGEADGELRLVRRETEETIAGLRGKIVFPSPLAVVEMTFDIENVAFPKPGLYSFDFYCNGGLVASKRFDVLAQEPMTPPRAPGPPASSD